MQIEVFIEDLEEVIADAKLREIEGLAQHTEKITERSIAQRSSAGQSTRRANGGTTARAKNPS